MDTQEQAMAKGEVAVEAIFLGREEIGVISQVEADAVSLPDAFVPPGETDRRVVRWWRPRRAPSAGREAQITWPSIVGWYDPMEVRDLPFELARLAPLRRTPAISVGGRSAPGPRPLLDTAGVVDGEAVLSFYRRRGPLYYLGQEIVEADVTSRPTRPGVRRFRETCALVGGDPCWWIRQQAKEMWLLLELWHAWREHDVPRLQELFGPVQKRLPVRPRVGGKTSARQNAQWEPDEWWRLTPKQQRERLLERRKHRWPEPECAVAGVTWTGERIQVWVAARGRAYDSIPGWMVAQDLPPEYRSPMPESECLENAWRLLQERIEHHLEDVAPSLALTKNNHHAVKPVLRYGNILEAIYLLLRRLIGEADRIGRCCECGLLFRVLREGREFCSPQHANTFWRREKRRAARGDAVKARRQEQPLPAARS